MRATVIVLAHGSEPHLLDCVESLADQAEELLVIDNEADPVVVARATALPNVQLITPGHNLGFAAGCNLGASRATGDVLVFVNSDAVASPGAVAALVGRLADRRIGLVSASVRLAESPEQVNSVGNPVHFLMFSWAGGLGEPAAAHTALTQVASITGAAFGVRREIWEELGGFEETYFAYCEDTYLSLRCWQKGYWVVHEPAAVVRHHYDPDRHRQKRYLLERNRNLNLLLLPEPRTLRLVAGPALLVELCVLAVAIVQGWGRDKVSGYRWLISHRRWLLDRRREVQSQRLVPDRELGLLLRGPLDPSPGTGPEVPAFLSRLLASYWRWAMVRL